jgi:Flp pilus assembly pilin Flp
MTPIKPTQELHAEVSENRTLVTALLRDFVRDERGQDLIEYGLLCGFITLGVVFAATNLGSATSGIYSGIDTQIAAIPAP